MFIIFEYLQTPLENLEPVLKEDIQKVKEETVYKLLCAICALTNSAIPFFWSLNADMGFSPQASSTQRNST